jgi:3-dehydroquinate dehydratase
VNSDVVFYYRTNPVGGALSISNYNWIKAMPNSVVAHSNNFVDVDIDVESIASFDSLQIKIVMIGSSSSQVPMCQDLRIIACA